MAVSIDGPGIIGRATAALRYAVTGKAPTDWFGPGTTLAAQAPENVRGRQFDYAFFANINYKPRGGEPLGFDRLKVLAKHPVVAMLIQRQKDKVTALDWQIKPRKKANDNTPDTADTSIEPLVEFFRYPDKEHDWSQWIGAVLDQLLVIDAVTIYAAPTRAGNPYALQLLDGAMVKPVLDLGGRRPLSPSPAYQQVLKGLPAIDYTADELIYFPQTYRADRVYGYSRVEQAADLIDAAVSRLSSQKGYFDFGNLGDGYFTAPENWTPDQVKDLQNQWNAMMQGVDPSMRRSSPFLPMGTEWHATKADVLSDEYDEFLIRLLCFPFGVAPSPFMKQMGLGKGSADTEQDAAEEGGIAPLMQYVERLMSMVLTKWFDRPDLEFAFVEDREFDPKVKAEIQDIRLRNGSTFINEVRDSNGEQPLPNGDKPFVYFTGEVQLLEDAIKPRPDPAPPIPGAGSVQPAGAEGTAPVGQAEVAPLTKAANAMGQMRLKIVLASYLTGKAAEFAEILADKLAKADKPDPVDFTSDINDALDALDFMWSDLPELLNPILAGIAVTAGTEAISNLGLFDAVTLARVAARAVDYANARAAEMVGMRYVDGVLVANPSSEWAITDATRNMLRTLITTSLTDGTSNDELRAQILEATAFSSDRADLIARSETAMADVRGAAMGWFESGVVDEVEFSASPDCCDECQAEDGTIVPLTDPEALDLPHPGCRCAWIAVIKDDPSIPGSHSDEE